MAKKRPTKKPELPDVDAPVMKSHEIKDQFDYAVAFDMAFVGVGQAGGRIAQTFWRMGYSRVAVINTAEADLAEIDKQIRTLNLGTGGAGKDPDKGRRDINGEEEAVFELFTRAIGSNPDYLLICAGLGGGTGGGATSTVVKVARAYMEEHGRDPSRVGLIVTLPRPSEGPVVCRNAVTCFRELHAMGCAPMVIVDNKRIDDLYDVGIVDFYPKCNERVAKLFHLFNQLAAQDPAPGGTSFDHEDFADVLRAGIVTFGAAMVEKYDTPADVSEAVRKLLAEVVLAEVDLRTGTRAGCLFVGNVPAILTGLPMKFFEGGWSMLDRLLAEGALVHRGIYEGKAEDLRCYTIVSGLAPPTARLRELGKKAFMPEDQLAEFLRV